MTPRESIRSLMEIPWIVFVIYWIVASIKTHAVRIEESFASRYGILALEIGGYVLVFSDSTRIGFLRAAAR